MVEATKNTLTSYKNEINWGKEKSLPFMQGNAINTIIKEYRLPAIRWGYSGSLIGIETEKQYLIWRDKGHALEFKGIIEKSEINENIPVKKSNKAKIDMNTKLFTDSNIDEVMDQVRKGLKFPYVDVHGSTFDKDDFYITISIQPKSEWNFGYINNTKHITIAVSQNRKVEAVKNYGLKFRGFRAKSIEEVIEKVNKITEK